MERCIKQNNGIDIYTDYFQEVDQATQSEAPNTWTVGSSLEPGHLYIVFCEDCIETQSSVMDTSGLSLISPSI